MTMNDIEENEPHAALCLMPCAMTFFALTPESFTPA
jgi:hypothetical protein